MEVLKSLAKKFLSWLMELTNEVAISLDFTLSNEVAIHLDVLCSLIKH